MNEININIPYSRFVDIFGCYFYVRMNSGDPSAVTRALDDAKYSWLIEWANSQFSTKQDHNTPRPLVDVLPVVNMAKVNHKAGD